MTNVYTAEEVSRHNQADDLWTVLNRNVYDLTYFLQEHPGGEDVLLESAGKDGTECFDSIGHSVEAVLMRERFKIGELEKGASMSAIEAISTEVPERVPSEIPLTQDDDWVYEVVTKSESQQLLLSIGVVGIVIYILLFNYLWR